MLKTVGLGEHILLVLPASASYNVCIVDSRHDRNFRHTKTIRYRLKPNTRDWVVRTFLTDHPKRGALSLALACVTVDVMGRVELDRCRLVA